MVLELTRANPRQRIHVCVVLLSSDSYCRIPLQVTRGEALPAAAAAGKKTHRSPKASAARKVSACEHVEHFVLCELAVA